MGMNKLLDIMVELRDPKTGCPWDREQDFGSIAPYTIEEAYEVADAINRQDYDELRGELGDLLLQVVFHAQMAKEAGLFSFDDVVEAICEKMVRRHPHVFAAENNRLSGPQETDSEKTTENNRFSNLQEDDSEKIAEIKRFWEQEKARERASKNKEGILSGIALNLPALVRAQKMQKRAAQLGFDWPDIDGVLAKLEEESGELSQAIRADDVSKIHEELGDLLFTCVNLSRWLKSDAETSLREANKKFEKRLEHVHLTLVKLGKDWHDCSPSELEGYWEEAKRWI